MTSRDGRGPQPNCPLLAARPPLRALTVAAVAATVAMVAFVPGMATAAPPTPTTPTGPTVSATSAAAQASAAAGVPLPPIPAVSPSFTDGQDPAALLARAIALLTAGSKAVPLQDALSGLQSSAVADSVQVHQAKQAAAAADGWAQAATTRAEEQSANARSLTGALRRATLTLYMGSGPIARPDYGSGDADAVMAAVIGEQVALSPRGILAERRHAADDAQAAAAEARTQQARADGDAEVAEIAQAKASGQVASMQSELATLGAASAKTLQAESTTLSRQAGADLTSAAALQFTPAAPVPPPVATATVALTSLFSELGKPYVYGATGPNTFDCSGLTQFVWDRAGVAIPRVAADQYAYTVPIPLSDLRPGDLVFFNGSDGTATSPGHEGMYIGGGLMINAPYTGTDVQVGSIWYADLIGFGRVHTPGVPVPSRAPIPPSTPPVVSALGVIPVQDGPPPGVPRVTEPGGSTTIVPGQTPTGPTTAPTTSPTTATTGGTRTSSTSSTTSTNIP